MMPGEELPIWVVYRNPRDCPGRFVVRRQRVVAGGQVLVDPLPKAITDSIDEARAAIPPGLYRLPRHPEDDAVIVECWI